MIDNQIRNGLHFQFHQCQFKISIFRDQNSLPDCTVTSECTQKSLTFLLNYDLHKARHSAIDLSWSTSFSSTRMQILLIQTWVNITFFPTNPVLIFSHSMWATVCLFQQWWTANEMAFIRAWADKAATVAPYDCTAICQTCHLTQSHNTQHTHTHTHTHTL